MKSGSTGQATRFVVLDSWRGLAATMVALFHLFALGPVYDFPLIRHGWLFVDFFFVLSGFVISHSYYSRLNAGGEVRAFVLQRFGRVYPLHLFMLGLYVLLELSKMAAGAVAGLTFDQPPFSGDRVLATIPSNLLLIQSLGVNHDLSWNRPSWSISVEFAAYLVFAAVVALSRWPRLWFAGVLLGSCAVLILFPQPLWLNVTYDLGIFRCLVGFTLGHFIWTFTQDSNGSDEVFARLVRRHGTAFEVVAAGLSLIFVALVNEQPASYAGPFIFAFTVLVFSYEAGGLSKVLRTRPFQVLGELSYSIYMVHAWLVLVFEIVLTKLMAKALGHSLSVFERGQVFLGTTPLEGTLIYVALLVCTIGMSFLTYRFVEAPGRAYFRKLARRGRPVAAPAE